MTTPRNTTLRAYIVWHKCVGQAGGSLLVFAYTGREARARGEVLPHTCGIVFDSRVRRLPEADSLVREGADSVYVERDRGKLRTLALNDVMWYLTDVRSPNHAERRGESR